MDLISRKAAQGRITEMIECVTNGDDGYYIGEKNALWHVEREIKKLPSVPAVPLDKLCEWLEVYARTPIYNMRHTAEWWKEELERWMEEQDK